MGILYSSIAHLFIVDLFIIGYSLYIYKIRWGKIILFNVIYFFFYCLTFLPTHYISLQEIIPGNWNWEGKLLSIIFLIGLLLFVKNKTLFFIPSKWRLVKKYLYLVLAVGLIKNSWTFWFFWLIKCGLWNILVSIIFTKCKWRANF